MFVLTWTQMVLTLPVTSRHGSLGWSGPLELSGFWPNILVHQ